MKQHKYKSKIAWAGNGSDGTVDYSSYTRNHVITIQGKSHEILGSSDPAFSGDQSRFNPEDLLLSSISACHMLWYLHLCTINEIKVVEYIDEATGVMEMTKDGSGKFVSVTLHPKIIILNDDLIDKSYELHEQANKMCFIANSCNFEILHQPTITIKSDE